MSRWTPRYAKHVPGLGFVFTYKQLRAAAISNHGTNGHRCHLCGDSWFKNEEHHSWIGGRRCLLDQIEAPRRRA